MTLELADRGFGGASGPKTGEWSERGPDSSLDIYFGTLKVVFWQGSAHVKCQQVIVIFLRVHAGASLGPSWQGWRW